MSRVPDVRVMRWELEEGAVLFFHQVNAGRGDLDDLPVNEKIHAQTHVYSPRPLASIERDDANGEWHPARYTLTHLDGSVAGRGRRGKGG